MQARRAGPHTGRGMRTGRPENHEIGQGQREESAEGDGERFNSLLGAGKTNRNSLSQCPKHAQRKSRERVMGL